MANDRSAEGTASGGSFLLEPTGRRRLFTAESFTEDQRTYYTAMRQFTEREVLPQLERIEAKDLPLLRELLAKAGALGLLLADVPEAFGGLELNVTSSMLMA